MASVTWWDEIGSSVQEWLVENNGDSIPADVAAQIRAAGGDATVGEPLPDEVIDWIEAVANGEPAE